MRNLTQQPISLILLQIAVVLGLLCVRFYHHPETAELPTESFVEHFSSGYSKLLEGDTLEVFNNLFNVEGSMPLEGLLDSLAVTNFTLSIILAALLILLIGFSIVRTMILYMVSGARNYLPALLFVVAGASIFFPGADCSILLSTLLLLIASKGFVDSFAHRENFGILFTSGLLLGLAPLLHAQSAAYILLIPVAMIIYKRNMREFIVTIAGALLPMTLFAYIGWAVGARFLEPFERVWSILMTPGVENWNTIPLYSYLIAGFITLGTIFSLIAWVSTPGTRNRARKLYRYMLWFMLLSIATLFLPAVGREGTVIVALPITFLLTHFYRVREGRIPLILYFTTLAVVIGVNIFPFIVP